MADLDLLNRLEARASQAESIIQMITMQISQIQSANTNSHKAQLKTSNEQLRHEVEHLKKQLIDIETQKGISQYYDFSKTAANVTPIVTKPSIKTVTTSDAPKPASEKKEKPKKIKKSDGGGGSKKEEVKEGPIDVARLDFRVGRIVSAKKHPDADSLYVEEVDAGEGKMRTVVSGLVKFIPEEEMQNRMVVLLCNLKPAKMRGVTSEAMVMCASTPDKVEILLPPPGSEPGELVEFEGYTRNPDVVLNPKKKIFETCAPDLKTNGDKIACFKGIPFHVPGKGNVVAPSLCDVQVK